VGGFITPPQEYFRIIERIFRTHDGVFISDEVQTGWGRTGGKWFGLEQYGVVPDFGLGERQPHRADRGQAASGLTGLTISTFGNPVTATAKAVLDFVEEHNLHANAKETGAYLRGRFEELKGKHEIIGDVRGLGCCRPSSWSRIATPRARSGSRSGSRKSPAH
jgi:4-aminobutyrate aminotransferase-like enzyme